MPCLIQHENRTNDSVAIATTTKCQNQLAGAKQGQSDQCAHLGECKIELQQDLWAGLPPAHKHLATHSAPGNKRQE
jgi:hypothetical protein